MARKYYLCCCYCCCKSISSITDNLKTVADGDGASLSNAVSTQIQLLDTVVNSYK